uniref:Uncharacterized protein n=1 Tax=Soybean thrips tombus-like virus 3 TaxID=2802945 RepID=A0A7T8G252_9TOMB|nr:hypothetical protein 1 [Soybean thrips tombus-like virus 3]
MECAHSQLKVVWGDSVIYPCDCHDCLKLQQWIHQQCQGVVRDTGCRARYEHNISMCQADRVTRVLRKPTLDESTEDIINNLSLKMATVVSIPREVCFEMPELQPPKGYFVTDVVTKTIVFWPSKMKDGPAKGRAVVFHTPDVRKCPDFKGVEKSVYQHKGLKNQCPLNTKEDSDDNKPIFVIDGEPFQLKKPPRWYQFGQKRALIKDLIKAVDVDLTYELKIEAAFCKRTLLLAASLKNKAKAILGRFDRRLITYKDEYQLVMSAVGAALHIDHAELGVRKILDKQERAISFMGF